jgi:hypothetical protein
MGAFAEKSMRSEMNDYRSSAVVSFWSLVEWSAREIEKGANLPPPFM